MPDLKLNWTVMNDAMEEQLFEEVVAEDPQQEEARIILDEFFRGPRMERMNAKAAELMAADSTRQLVREDFLDFDVFQGDEAQRKEISEAYGTFMGINIRSSRLPLQTYWFKKGIEEYAAGEATIDEGLAQAIIQDYYITKLPLQNAAESKAWLAEVEKQKGVQKTESGLLYRIDREGDAAVKPTAEDTVKVDYEGKLKDGFVFDSSYERGESIEFPLNGVIKGWTEGLQLVGKGGQITLWIPSELGYGVTGSGPIGPNAALEFKVELHDVIRAGAEPASAE
ncbi:MAG: FKBP-type peptidyl-prolyl cis-trans isomerase [Alistipes sp.]|nr:FKBP-type peptidyl-prolyl cis-trans isomerase [Alistipes sp.]MBQ6580671.1 FKBP-type peptidyl-prolyl cis-trans isomerase [Alistipes sp.]